MKTSTKKRITEFFLNSMILLGAIALGWCIAAGGLTLLGLA